MNMPTDDSLSTLTELGNDLYDAETEVLRLEAELKRAKKRRDGIAQTDIPEAMKEVGLSMLQTTDGAKIELKDVLSVTPLKKNRPLVFKALEDQGAGNLIKTTVIVPFNKGEAAAIKELFKALRVLNRQAKEERKVESQTLKKHVKDRLEEGEEVDMELFGVRQFEIAHFSDGGPKPPVFEGE